MKKYCRQEAQDTVEGGFAALAQVGPTAGTTVEIAHENAEGQVGGDGQEGAGGRHGKAVTHYVAYIFEGGKAKRNEDGVNYAVETIIEIRSVPGVGAEADVFCSLFNYCDDAETKNGEIKRASVGQHPVQGNHGDGF